MSRRIVVSIAAALALAPFTVFAAEGGQSSHMNCECSHSSAKSTTSAAKPNTAPVKSYQGMTQAELERIWASP